jgi:tetratricopeptide (TPR) repeat protein
MSKGTILTASLTLVLGFAVGTVLAKKNPTASALFMGKDNKDAAAALLAKAREYAADGSWEKIAVARVYYLTGQKDEGQKLMDSATAKKPEASDWIRIGRVYYEAGDWEKAQGAFEKVLKLTPDDADWLAEVGAYYLVKGDRARAEQLFQHSLAVDPESMRNVLRMAGGYLGLAPRE